MKIRSEVNPFLLALLVLSLLLFFVLRSFGAGLPGSIITATLIFLVVGGYLLFFFRDPTREIAEHPTNILAAADGKVARIKEMKCEEFFGDEPVIRVSIFLSLFNVHVNRSPIAGTVRFLEYYPGKRFFTFQEKSSDYNQHNSIVIENAKTKCLVNQIVGPVCRRVVHWLTLDQQLQPGDKIGMMKFGSRLDMYFPAKDVEIDVKIGTNVNAGLSVIGKLKGE